MKLRLLTWNISYAYGLGSEGTPDYHQRDKVHFDLTLNSMAEFIRNTEIDIALLQEVDFDCKRSHHVHQLDWLARKTGLLYRSQIVSWNSLYVPYPGLNPLRQFGKTVSGGGVLSRYPLQIILEEDLPKPRENSAIYNFFYLHRYLQVLSVQLKENDPNANLTLMNLHLEAFSEDNRELHLEKAQNRVTDYGVDLTGGDFNGSIQLEPEFLERNMAIPSPLPTFPSQDPQQTIDGFILKKNRFKVVKIERLDTGSLSDHFPVLLEVEIL